jgi:hypothetical protein
VISSDHLDPGASGRIRATVDTTGRAGPLEKHIVVYSNDRRTPVLTLSLSLHVAPK